MSDPLSWHRGWQRNETFSRLVALPPPAGREGSRRTSQCELDVRSVKLRHAGGCELAVSTSHAVMMSRAMVEGPEVLEHWICLGRLERIGWPRAGRFGRLFRMPGGGELSDAWW